MAIRAGKLRHRVQVEEPREPEVVEPLGDPRERWRVVGRRWAAIEPVAAAGREYPLAAAIQADATVRVTLRYFPGLTPRHRLTLGGRVFEVKGVELDDGKREWTVAHCREVL